MINKTWTIDGNGIIHGSILGYPVQYHEIARPGGADFYVVDKLAQLFNDHTTEGDDIYGALGTLRSKFAGGHFLVGPDDDDPSKGMLFQTRPMWAQGSLLLGEYDTNHWCRIQVEVVGFSKTTPWMHQPGSMGPYIAVAYFAAVEYGIPLKMALSGWTPGTWAKSGPNAWRDKAEAAGLMNLVGFLPHSCCPENAHWDCGAFKYTDFFAMVQARINEQEDEVDPRISDELLGQLKALAAKVAPHDDQLAGLAIGGEEAMAGAPRPTVGEWKKAGWDVVMNSKPKDVEPSA